MASLNYDTLTVTAATQIQHELRNDTIIQPRNFPVNVIAGADISFNKFSTAVYAGIILLRFPELIPIGYSLFKKDADGADSDFNLDPDRITALRGWS